MKALCTRQLTGDGYEFRPGEEYYFDVNAYMEPYNPEIHTVRPARGWRIRYDVYRATVTVGEPDLSDPAATVELRTVWLYDRAYCEHHHWRDPDGQRCVCFDDHFMPQPTAECEPLIKPGMIRFAYPDDPDAIHLNEQGEIEMPKRMRQQMLSNISEWEEMMLGRFEPVQVAKVEAAELQRALDSMRYRKPQG